MLEYVLYKMHLPLFGESNAIRIWVVRGRPYENEVHYSSNNRTEVIGESIYVLFLHYFNEWEGNKSNSNTDTFFLYSLSWYILLSVLEDELNQFVFTLAIQIAGAQSLPGTFVLGISLCTVDSAFKMSLEQLDYRTW